MADGHTASQAEGAGPLGDAVELLDTLLSGFVQMNVDLHAAPVGNPEDNVELAVSSTIKGCRVDTTHHLDSILNRRIENIGRSGAGDDAGLGKSNQFDIDDITPLFSCLHDGVQVGQAGCGIDVDVTAHGDCTEGYGLLNQCAGAFGNGGRLGQLSFLDGQAVPEVMSGLMRLPAIANEALVEVDMTVDETGDHQAILQIDDLRRLAVRSFGAYVDDVTALDRNVDLAAVSGEGIDEEAFSHIGSRMVKDKQDLTSQEVTQR